MILFCSYVFGPEWQDIKYFQKLDEALEAMKNDYNTADLSWIDAFSPFIVTYSSEGGRLQEKDVWRIKISDDNINDNFTTKDGHKMTIFRLTAEEEWGC